MVTLYSIASFIASSHNLHHELSDLDSDSVFSTEDMRQTAAARSRSGDCKASDKPLVMPNR